MIIPYGIQHLFGGSKTQHRIPVRPGDSLSWVEQYNGYTLALPPDKPILVRKGRQLYRVGGHYAIQPRGKQRAVAEVEILRLTGEDIRDMTQEEAYHEGFIVRETFWWWWCQRYDPDIMPFWEVASLSNRISDLIKDRSAEHYQCWRLDWKRTL